MEENNGQVGSIYGFLARIFSQEVTSDFLAELRAPHFRGVLEELGIDLGDDFYSSPADKLLEDLVVEYTGLFIGPGHFISPHESVHRVRDDGDYGKLWGADTVAVKKFIEATGLSYQSSFGGMPDHIAAEFEFVQKLDERLLQAQTDGEKELAGNLAQIKQRFLQEHLLAWIPDFLDKVAAKANLPFYRETALLASQFIASEKEALFETEGSGTIV
ncbi:MAG: molecular chaperone TorD family protein [Desulfobulbaceae bacterium]|nr:molecular chaperone TorD family protein [Desulfobulbaceae bacterium]